MGIPDHLICLLRKLRASQEATVIIGHETTDWFQIGKEVHQGCMLSSCLFNYYAEHIIQNDGLDEAQAGIKTVERNINNLRKGDTSLVAESEEELKTHFFNFFFNSYFILIYNTVLVLPYIDMNQPRVYMSSQS